MKDQRLKAVLINRHYGSEHAQLIEVLDELRGVYGSGANALFQIVKQSTIYQNSRRRINRRSVKSERENNHAQDIRH